MLEVKNQGDCVLGDCAWREMREEINENKFFKILKDSCLKQQ